MRRAASCSLAHFACVLPCMTAILPLWLLSSATYDVPSLHPCLSPCVSASLCGSASAFLCCAPSPTKSTGAGGTSVSSLPYHMFTWWCVCAWRENVGILERDCSTSEKDRTVKRRGTQWFIMRWLGGHEMRMLQCVAVCCSVLQCVAVCCSVLQCVAVCCSVLQCAAVCCSVLQYVAVCCSVFQCVAASCNVLQCVTVCCSVLQRVAVCCSVF